MTSRIFNPLFRHLGAAVLVALLTVSSAATALAVSVSRGPYLQLATDTGMVLRWRTDVAENSAVCIDVVQAACGTLVSDAVAKTEHETALSGLSTGTTYYYRIGFDDSGFEITRLSHTNEDSMIPDVSTLPLYCGTVN